TAARAVASDATIRRVASRGRRFLRPSSGRSRARSQDRALGCEPSLSLVRAIETASRISDQGARPRRARNGRVSCGRRYWCAVDIPVQFFQSAITIELPVAGAPLWEIRYFERGGSAGGNRNKLPDSRLQLFFALVIGATVFGSLWAIADEGQTLAATFITMGVA